MNFHFPLMPRLFMAVRAWRTAFPIIDILEQTPAIPARLPVGDLPAQPRRADARDGHRRGAGLHVPDVYAHDPLMRINLGIRRRLAPLLGNDRRKIELMNGLLFSCPARRSSTTATRSAWATTSTSATATACARPCSGAPTATPGSRTANPQRLYLPVDHRPRVPLRGGQRRGPATATPSRCCGGCARSSPCAGPTRCSRTATSRSCTPRTTASSPSSGRSRARRRCSSWRTCPGSPRRWSSTCATTSGGSPTSCSAGPSSPGSASSPTTSR